ncbi:MAG TPA: SLBB domain-containing protein [Rhizomicrobium sp.]|jgi:protein involved in polysaccharide export with SLBB domain
METVIDSLSRVWRRAQESLPRHCGGDLRIISSAVFAAAALLVFCAYPARASDSADGICATTSDPAACEKMIDNAVSRGSASSAGAGGIDQLLQGYGSGQSSSGIPGMIDGPQPSVVVTPGQPGSRHAAEHSHLEIIYSRRAGKPLTQFGYDILGNGGSVSALQIGSVQDQYILGQGDQVVVTLRGQENATYNIFVDRDGNVTLPRLRPISASGRRFGDFRRDLDAAIHEGYIQTEDYITIGQVRQISVNVAGEVFRPGVYALSGLSTVLDALVLAGGVRKAGSLRNIAVVRDGHALRIDLYRFLSPEGKSPDTTLRQGDRIVVSPIGATIAVAGEVRRPGIYEIEPGGRSATLRWAIAKANGYAIRGAYRLTLLRTRADGRLEYDDISGRDAAALDDGDILIVANAVNYTLGEVTLEGNVRLPGDYALNKVRTLHDLLPSSESFLPLTYTPFAFIVRQDQTTLQRRIIPFSIAQILAGTYNMDLQSQDVVHVLTLNAMRQLLDLSSAPRNAEGAPALMARWRSGREGALPGMPCLAEEEAIRNLPRPERARSATSLKLPHCPAPQLITSATSRSFADLLSGGLVQTPPSQLLGAQAGGKGVLDSTAEELGSSTTGSIGGTIGSADEGSVGGSVAGAAGLASAASESGSGSTGSGVEGLTMDETAALGLVVGDYRVTVDGAVRDPGTYLAAPGVPLGEIVDAANGLSPDADLDAVEITSVVIDNIGGHSTTSRKLLSLTPQSLASVALQRLDVVQIPRVPSEQEEGNVVVEGEVRFPGTYHILKGEKLSSLLARAGGLTSFAYPMGAVFQRPSVARLQQTAYGREAEDLQEQLMASVAQGGGVLSSAGGQSLGLSPEAAGFVESVISQLRTKTADGRISILADPVALAANPQADIQLQPGDSLFLPKRPTEVMVTGEVLSPGNYRYAPKLGVSDFIAMSGGFNRYADDDHIFVINPDGTARGVSDDLFNFTSDALAPGTVIVVPRDLKPLDLGALTVTVAKVFSDFAISAASIAVLAHSTN